MKRLIYSQEDLDLMLSLETQEYEDKINNLQSKIDNTIAYYYKTLSQYNNQNKKMPDEAVEMFNLLEVNK